ncbi:MAG: hypothetical protein FRX49_07707 [Trebouxia sp. A1-2]|nr:MAG: hypothetical protein FRX49_07707 [Trebouxia sp. A1-2]
MPDRGNSRGQGLYRVPAMQAITRCCSQQQGSPVLKRHDCAAIPMGLLQTYKQLPLFVSDHECKADLDRQDLSSTKPSSSRAKNLICCHYQYNFIITIDIMSKLERTVTGLKYLTTAVKAAAVPHLHRLIVTGGGKEEAIAGHSQLVHPLSVLCKVGHQDALGVPGALGDRPSAHRPSLGWQACRRQTKHDVPGVGRCTKSIHDENSGWKALGSIYLTLGFHLFHHAKRHGLGNQSVKQIIHFLFSASSSGESTDNNWEDITH